MIKTLLTILASVLTTLMFGQAWNYQWAVGIGSLNDEDGNVLVDVDSDDNVYMAFEYLGALNVGAENYPAPVDEGRDVLLVKLSPTGEILWSGSIKGEAGASGILGGDRVSAVHVDKDDHVIITGNIGMNGSVFGTPNGISEERNFIVKINPDGEVMWEVYADDNFLNDEFTALTSDENGDIFLTTRTEENLGFYGIGGMLMGVTDIQNYYYTLAKITSEGIVEYVELLPTGVPSRIQLDSNGDFIISSEYGENTVSGYALHKISASDFTTIWARENTGGGQDSPSGGNLGFHVKQDDSIVQFLKTTGTIAYSDADPADCDDFCTMGVLVNIDADGNTVSTHTMESRINNPEVLGLIDQNFFPTAFEAIDDNSYYIAGRLMGSVEFSNGYTFEPSEWYLGDFGYPRDAFVIKVDDELNISEYAAKTGTASQRSQNIAVFSDGDAAIGGSYIIESFGGFTGTTVFGEDELIGYGEDDYFVTRVETGTDPTLSATYEDKHLAFDLYPNPSVGFANLRFTIIEGSEALMEVIDNTGKIIQAEKIRDHGSVQHSMDTSQLSPGVYTIKLTTDSAVGTKAFVVAR